MPAPRNRLAAVVVGVLVLGVAVLAVTFLVIGASPITGTAVRSPTEQLTDSEQIEETVAAFGQAWNDRDFDAMKPIVCASTKEGKEFTRSEFLEARNGSGRLTLVVDSVEIDGDTATAEVSNAGKNSQAIRMAREAGAWKWCEF